MTGARTGLAVGAADVEAAAERLRGVAVRTPVVRSRELEAALGGATELHVKAECLQRSGAFKFRGAWNRLSQLPEGAAVVAGSSGNHAQAIALAARLRNQRATIVMPHDAPALKRARTEAHGAEVVGYDRYAEDRAAVSAAVARERDAVEVPAFDDADVVAGQGTATLELLEDAPQLDVLYVPTSGGGLLAGAAAIAAARAPGLRLVGVEPEAGDDVRRSLAAGERVRIPVPRTIADALTIDAPGALTFPILQAHGVEVETVTDAELVAAMRLAFEELKLVLEPGGAAGLAAAVRAIRAGQARGLRVGVIASGGNVAPDGFATLVRGAA